jgi:hypothetical protein
MHLPLMLGTPCPLHPPRAISTKDSVSTHSTINQPVTALSAEDDNRWSFSYTSSFPSVMQ